MFVGKNLSLQCVRDIFQQQHARNKQTCSGYNYLCLLLLVCLGVWLYIKLTNGTVFYYWCLALYQLTNQVPVKYQTLSANHLDRVTNSGYTVSGWQRSNTQVKRRGQRGQIQITSSSL